MERTKIKNRGQEAKCRRIEKFGKAVRKVMDEENIDAEQGWLAVQRFGLEGLRLFVESRVSVKNVTRYPKSFSAPEVIALKQAGCSPHKIKRYGEGVTGWEAYLLHIMGVAAEPSWRKNHAWYSLMCEFNRNYSWQRDADKFKLLGVGNHAVVVAHNGRTYKIGTSLEEEVRILRKIRQQYGASKHIVELRKVKHRGLVDIVEFETLLGITLLKLTERPKKIKANRVITYGQGIFSALKVLKEVEVYHRDLWLGNVMTNGYGIKVFDFGCATDEANAGPMDCRRYGGENDIQSLGQILGKLYTGNNLFNLSARRTKRVPDEVKENREHIYQDKRLLNSFLEGVQGIIKYPILQEIITTCLSARSREDNSNFAPDEVYEHLNDLFQKAA